jgi:hypothetical protein
LDDVILGIGRKHKASAIRVAAGPNESRNVNPLLFTAEELF